MSKHYCCFSNPRGREGEGGGGKKYRVGVCPQWQRRLSATKKQPMGAALLQPSSPPPPPSSSGSGSRYMASGSECGTAAVVHTAAVFDKKEEGRGTETTPRALFAGDIVKEEGREGRCFIDRL